MIIYKPTPPGLIAGGRREKEFDNQAGLAYFQNLFEGRLSSSSCFIGKIIKCTLDFTIFILRITASGCLLILRPRGFSFICTAQGYCFFWVLSLGEDGIVMMKSSKEALCAASFKNVIRKKVSGFLLKHFSAKVLTKVADIVAFPISAYCRRTRYPHLIVRKGTSDMAVFRKIFVTKDYDFDYALNPKLIIDGGANVGYASVFFANKFPEAHIFAIEPEDSNFEILVSNVSKYDTVTPLKKGLWPRNGFLRIADNGAGKWAFMTIEVSALEQYDVEVVTINDILRTSKCEEIDILKLDIEGAKKELFSSSCVSWLGKVNVLIIKLHDNMKKGCSEAFYSAIEKYDFEKEIVGENVILRRRSAAGCKGCSDPAERIIDMP